MDTDSFSDVTDNSQNVTSSLKKKTGSLLPVTTYYPLKGVADILMKIALYFIAS
jgi:hypothetical protein